MTGIELSDAIAFEGSLANMKLSRSMQLGDFDGDGHADTLISGPEYAFLLNGPVGTTDSSRRQSLQIFNSISLRSAAQQMEWVISMLTD